MGYEYDDYGPEKRWVAGYIAPAVSAHRLQAFYPSTHPPSTRAAHAAAALC